MFISQNFIEQLPKVLVSKIERNLKKEILLQMLLKKKSIETCKRTSAADS